MKPIFKLLPNLLLSQKLTTDWSAVNTTGAFQAKLLMLIAVGIMLLAGASKTCGQGTAPTSDYTNSFDTASSTASWIYWYGLGFNNTPMTWDSTMDAQNNPNSGSLMVSLPFGSTGDQGVWFGTFHNGNGYDGTTIYDGTKFTNITVDVHVDPAAPLSSSGDFGTLQVGLVRQGWPNGGTYDPNGPTIPGNATNGWVHLNQTIDQTGANLDTVAGVNFKYTSFSGYPKSPITFWIDNLVVHLATTKAAPPKMGLPYRPTAGLNLFSSGSNGDQYQRTNIKLQNAAGNGWLGATSAATFSLTITNFPNGATYPGYQGQIFITTGTPSATETAPDYTETNLIFLDIHENADGSAYAAFRYKTNQPNGNAMVFNSNPTNGPVGTLGIVGSSTVLGTWSLGFNSDTNITVTAPDGTNVGHFTMTEDAAVLFADPLNVYFGAQPNSPANFGQSVVLSRVAISGNSAPISDNFLADNGVLDTNNTWTIVAGDINTVQLLQPDPGALFVKWSLPDSGFGLQASTNLGDTNAWRTLTGPDATAGPLFSLTSAGSRLVYLPSSIIGSSQEGYFRLLQQVFSKLQVLMPGETNAPGTASGKIGTPIAQVVGVPFDVTVNAVDNTCHLISSATDTVHITSSDSSASLPADAALVQGTGTFTVTFNASGTFTVTATDTTDSTKAANTGTATTVTP